MRASPCVMAVSKMVMIDWFQSMGGWALVGFSSEFGSIRCWWCSVGVSGFVGVSGCVAGKLAVCLYLLKRSFR